MAMSESSGSTGGYGVRPANPSGKVIKTSGAASGNTRPPKLLTQPRTKKKRKG